MPTTLAISFPWGRYHATPWTHHVNEGLVEWPPSPWRLLRALYATWQCRVPDLDSSEVLAVLDAICEPPAYWVPPSRRAHTRHYMPDIKQGKDKAFDAFESFERGAELLVRWGVELAPAARQILARLAELMPYVGRADSICEARLVVGDEVPLGSPWLPAADPGGQDPDQAPAALSMMTPTELLVPLRPLDVGALTVRTSGLRAQRLVEPSGATWVRYRPPVPEAVGAGRAATRIRPRPTAMRWSISTPALPSLHAAVTMADVLRYAAMARYGRANNGAASPVLAGKDEAGRPTAGHCHAHYLAVDADGDRLLDTLVLWAPAGLADTEVAVLASLRELHGFGHISDFRPCRLGLEALGDVAIVAPELVGPAKVWKSHTPFAPPRHAHKRQDWRGHVMAEVKRELASRGFPAPAAVELFDGDHDWLDFRRHRVNKSEHLADARRASGVMVVFDETVLGPVAIGALSHFGLGLMVPSRD